MTTEHLIEKAAKAMVALAPGETWEDCDQNWYLRDARAALAVFEEDHTVTDGSVHVTARHSTSVTNSEAHTPTNDERARVVSALEDLAIEHNLFDVVVAEEIADAVLAGFRRYDPPTNDEREALTDAALWDFADDLLDAWNIEDRNPPSLTEDFRDRFVSRFRRSEVPEPSAEDYPDAEGLAVLRSNSSEPQGEPSDAHYEYHETRRPDGSWSFTHRSECFCEKRENHWSPDRLKLLAAANAYMHYAPPYDDLSAFSDQFLNDMRAALKAAFDQKGES